MYQFPESAKFFSLLYILYFFYILYVFLYSLPTHPAPSHALPSNGTRTGFKPEISALIMQRSEQLLTR